MSAVAPSIRVLTGDGLREVGLPDLPALLERLKDPAGLVVWVHSESEPGIVQALDDMGLDEIAVKSLRDGPERPRV